ncbi:MAG: hypothetical protein LUI14_12415 [Lachnospiraceae bacterium]|nr:hypothetical protein [Lachnospiraceae bacterium]
MKAVTDRFQNDGDLIRAIGPESTQSIPILQDYLRDMGYGKLAERITHSACPLRQKL